MPLILLSMTEILTAIHVLGLLVSSVLWDCRHQHLKCVADGGELRDLS